MRYVINKLLVVDPGTRDEHGATVSLSHDNGQTRKLTGKIGTRDVQGEHIVEVRGDGILHVSLENPKTIFQIRPLND